MNDPIAENAKEAGAAAVGSILLHTRKLEGLLRSISGSDAAGMHDLTDAVGERLDDDLRRTLHRLAAVRNHAAHEEQFQLTAEELAAFERDAAAAEAALQVLLPSAPRPAAPQPVTPSVLPPPHRPTPPPPAVRKTQGEAIPEEALDLAVEQEFFQNLRRRLILLGYLPILGIGNFLRLVLESLLADEWMLFCGILYLSAWPLTIQGIREERAMLWQAGAGIAGFTWIAALVRLFRQDPKKHPMPWWLLGVPGLHGLGLWWAFFRKVPLGKCATALIGLGLLVLAGYWAWQGNWKACGWTVAAEWAVSIFAAFRWRR